jgi:hypothetical protein
MFIGQGSFGDLALWVGDTPLPEDPEFDKLRNKLLETLKKQL